MTLEWHEGLVKVGVWVNQVVAVFEFQPNTRIEVTPKWRNGAFSMELYESNLGGLASRHSYTKYKQETPFKLHRKKTDQEVDFPIFGLVEIGRSGFMRRRCKGLYEALMPKQHLLPWPELGPCSLFYTNPALAYEHTSERLYSARQAGLSKLAVLRWVQDALPETASALTTRELTCPSTQD